MKDMSSTIVFVCLKEIHGCVSIRCCVVLYNAADSFAYSQHCKRIFLPRTFAGTYFLNDVSLDCCTTQDRQI